MAMREMVVIIDDDPIIVEFLRDAISLLEPSWEIATPATGDEALSLLERNPLSCLVTDLLMPGQDGIELAKQVRSLDDRTLVDRYVLVMTGKAEARMDVLSSANEFIEKPPDPRELVALLRQGLRFTRHSLERLNTLEELGRLAWKDPLTGLANRRSGITELDREMERWRRTGDPFSVVMIDLDHFKLVNDELGHRIGDEVLELVSLRIQELIRPFDTLVRWGGEEFLLILPHTDGAGAEAVARRLCEAMRSKLRTSAKELVVTGSFGAASIQSGVQTREELVDSADEALYAAKRQGRDQVVGATMREEARTLDP